MTTDLISFDPAPLTPALDAAQAYAEQSRADNTKRAYRSDWTGHEW